MSLSSILFLGLLLLLQFRLWLCLFFHPFVSAPSFPHAAVPAAPCSLSLRFSACCGYGWFFRSSSAFPHAAAKAAPSCLPQRFCLLQLQLLFSVFVPVFRMLRLRLLLSFLAQLLLSSLLMVLWLCLLEVRLLHFCSFLSTGFRRLLLLLISLFLSAAFSPWLSPHPHACLRCSSIRLRFLLSRSAFLCLCDSLVSLVLLTRSDLRFPSG